MEHIYDDFIESMGLPIHSEPVPREIIEKYSGLIMGDDVEDIIVQIWEKFGFSGYKNGLFWLVNPEDYNPIARGI